MIQWPHKWSMKKAFISEYSTFRLSSSTYLHEHVCMPFFECMSFFVCVPFFVCMSFYVCAPFFVCIGKSSLFMSNLGIFVVIQGKALCRNAIYHNDVTIEYLCMLPLLKNIIWSLQLEVQLLVVSNLCLLHSASAAVDNFWTSFMYLSQTTSHYSILLNPLCYGKNISSGKVRLCNVMFTSFKVSYNRFSKPESFQYLRSAFDIPVS